MQYANIEGEASLQLLGLQPFGLLPFGLKLVADLGLIPHDRNLGSS